MLPISKSLSPTNAYLTQQAAKAKDVGLDNHSQPNSEVKAGVSAVTLSAMGQQMALQDKAWSILSPSELKGVFDRSWDKIMQLDDQVRAVGMAAFDDDIPANGTLEQIGTATAMRDFMVSLYSLPQGKVANPYAGYSRESLSSILYDETGAYSKSEKVAAVSEQQKQDFAHFSALFASNATSNDHRQMYLGILDFYDKLSPVEQSAYPPGYKQDVGEFLRREETLFGVLSESDKQAIQEKNKNSSRLVIKSDEPIWKQLIGIPASLSGISKA